ncbi:MAG: hypothetical protein CL910_12185 [Deltaproteobacteria bacterium]|jgi:hypothetical protein|nr:hypothetical protein [Deltaproteobacteria bacterium]
MKAGTRQGGLAFGLAGLAFVMGSCVMPGSTPHHYNWFELPREQDPWRRPILDWQGRVRNRHAEPLRSDAPDTAAPGRAGKPAEPEELALAYQSFQEEERRRTVLRVGKWIREQSRLHFVPDPGIDIWPTAQEVLESGGDDCDGLAFLTHQMLLELGFEREDLYLAIVRRHSDALHHMISLWFGDGEDPWVIDPTGAMTNEMVRMSEINGWEPLAVFSETQHYRALPHVASASPSE